MRRRTGVVAATGLIAAIAAVPVQAAFGVLDPSWGGDGRVTTAVSPGAGQDGIQDIALQSDGKVVAAGYMDSDPGAGNDYDFAVARYNADGSLDGGFGGDGIVSTPIGSGDDDVGIVSGVAIQADGKIVAAGYAAIGSPSHWEFAVVRYNADGSLDDAGGGGSFGGDGIVTTPVGVPSMSSGFGNDVGVQADGKIVVAGEGDYDGATDEDFTLVRYEADGDLDAGFDGDPGNPGGGNGIIATDFSGDEGFDLANAIAIQTDGRIVAAGGARTTVPTHDFAIARYETDGTLDTDFDGPGGGNGKFTTDFGTDNEAANDVAIQGDGKIVAAGQAVFAGGFQFALARYGGATGSLDPSFDGDPGNAGGGNGKVATDVTGGSSNDNAREVEIEAGGKIVVAGSSDVDPNPGGHFDFAVARYSSADGTLDRSFAGDGVTTIAFPPETVSDNAYGAAIQPNGRIVVGGTASEDVSSGGTNFATVRLGPEQRCGGSAATITGTTGGDTLRGTAGRDVFAGLGGNDVIRGLGGRDLACGGAGRDRLVGGAGRDRLLGQGGRDRLIGGRGRDTLKGAGGRDVLRGGPGRDVLRGGPGRDVLRGGPGRDVLRGGGGRDRQFQ